MPAARQSGKQGALRLSLYRHCEGDLGPEEIKTRLCVPAAESSFRRKISQDIMSQIESLYNHKYSESPTEREVTQNAKFFSISRYAKAFQFLWNIL